MQGAGKRYPEKLGSFWVSEVQRAYVCSVMKARDLNESEAMRQIINEHKADHDDMKRRASTGDEHHPTDAEGSKTTANHQ